MVNDRRDIQKRWWKKWCDEDSDRLFAVLLQQACGEFCGLIVYLKLKSQIWIWNPHHHLDICLETIIMNCQDTKQSQPVSLLFVHQS